MTNVAISALPAASALDGTELVPIVQGGVTSQTTALDVVRPSNLNLWDGFVAPEPPARKKWDRAAYMREWRKTHPLTPEQRFKDNARSYAGVYKRRGKIVPKPCQDCGEPAEMHHPDYSQPLLVEWMCRKCHLQHHKS